MWTQFTCFCIKNYISPSISFVNKEEANFLNKDMKTCLFNCIAMNFVAIWILFNSILCSWAPPRVTYSTTEKKNHLLRSNAWYFLWILYDQWIHTVNPSFKGHQREDVKLAAFDRWLLIQGSIWLKYSANGNWEMWLLKPGCS